MTSQGWTPYRHFARDVLIAIFAVMCSMGIEWLMGAKIYAEEPQGIFRETVFQSIAVLSGTMTGTSIIATTMIVGWWDTNRLSSITSIPTFGNTMLLLLKANTWILAAMTILSILLMALGVSSQTESWVIPLYVPVMATAINYFRRTIYMLYRAAELVTKGM